MSRKTSLVSVFVFFIVLACPVFSYSGGFAVVPPLAGGPGSNTVSNFDIDTRVTNPQTIVTNLNYVQQVIIQTSTPERGNLLITENPSSGQIDPSSFSFSVPQKIQDALVSATVYFWGPDQPTLLMTHVHQGVATEVLTATRVSPEQRDAQGRVLWTFTTTSFSEFIMVQKPPRPITPFVVYLALILVASASSIALFKPY